MQVVVGRPPAGEVGVDLVAAADVLDLVRLVAGRGNQTYGMPRRSACRICRPNFAAVGATSVAMPRPRSVRAISRASGRSSSCGSATRTHEGTDRSASSCPRAISGASRRVMPSEMPTPGYVVRPSVASES